MFSVKMSLIPETGALIEKGLVLTLGQLELEEPFIKPVTVDYELSLVYGKVLAKVQAKGRLELECSRCLKDFEQAADADFFAEFEPKPEEAHERSGIDPDDPGPTAVYFEGEILPLGEEIRQELELKVPFAPLCSPGCKGLCPSCGADRNSTACGCDAEQKESPFKGLEKLFNQSKEN